MFKIIHGFGINNANYPINKNIDGKNWRCPIYKRWKSMMARCYGTDPRGSSVSEGWRYYMDFYNWCVPVYNEDYTLDKDLILPGNNIYGPDTCAFIPSRTNALLTDSNKARGDLPIGVSHIDRPGGNYQAQCSIEGTRKYLGLFFDKYEAHKAWQFCKIISIQKEMAYLKSIGYEDQRVLQGLSSRIEILENDILNQKETVKL